ncbi:MAG TPA: prolyl oligopeptidase family serine peptidase [Bryobacteraceae bacterium]|nr:prolyl oligopeptidase family serine peptidase [Bryobacteraceae bacterium]
MTRRSLLSLPLALSSVTRAQQHAAAVFLAQVRKPPRPVRSGVTGAGETKPNEQAVLDEIEHRAAAALARIHHARTPEEASEIRAQLRPKLEASLGYRQLPWPPDLKLRHVGTLQRPSHRIEKLVYEALPGMLVPAHLYLPEKLAGPAPAIAFYVGHWWEDSKARPDFQAFCATMARQGFIVLTWDPFGQGERGVSSRDHRRVETLLVGIAQQGLAEHETRCALEILLSRGEVDPQRLGFTGASGGGYNTWITSVLDDRIAVSVPVVGTSDFYEQIATTRPLDWYHASEHCHYVPGLIQYANNHEFLAAIAPKPLKIIAAAADQSFPIRGVRQVYEYGRQLYNAFGTAEKIGFYVDTVDGHGYQIRKREAAYGWFRRWLMNQGDGSSWPEPKVETLPFDSPELRCFPPGRNEPAGPAIIAEVHRLARNLPPPSPKAPLDDVLGIPASSASPPIHVGKTRTQRLSIPSEGGVFLPAVLQQPDASWKGVVIALDDRGKEEAAAALPMDTILGKGWAVCAVDVRGLGELATTQMKWIAAVSLLLNENYVGRQAWDITCAAQSLQKPFALYARGDNAALAALYAVARSKPRFYILRDGFLSYRQFIERPQSFEKSYRLQPNNQERFTPFDREIPFHYIPFNALHAFDLPQLLAASAAPGLIVNPIDGDWNRMKEADARKLLAPRLQVVSKTKPEADIGRFLTEML